MLIPGASRRENRRENQTTCKRWNPSSSPVTDWPFRRYQVPSSEAKNGTSGPAVALVVKQPGVRYGSEGCTHIEFIQALDQPTCLAKLLVDLDTGQRLSGQVVVLVGTSLIRHAARLRGICDQDR